MEKTSRREFMAAAGSAAFAGTSGAILGRYAFAEDTSINGKRLGTKPPVLYEREKVPRVDIHMHITLEQLGLVGEFVKVMDAGRIAVSVNLSGTREMLEQSEGIRKTWSGRILLCPGDYDTSDGLWWSEDDLTGFKEQRCAGTKIWAKYRQGILTAEFVKNVRRQGELGLPVIGFHYYGARVLADERRPWARCTGRLFREI